jgi:V/A-type H+-transporting ATPase subunit I
LTDIEQYRKAVDFLSTFATENDSLVSESQPYASGKEAFERYMDATQRRAALLGESQRLRKLSEEL